MLKSLSRIKNIITRSNFFKYYNNCQIDNKIILLQSFGGTNIFGNPYYLLLELCKEKYNNYNKYIAVLANKKGDIEKLIRDKCLKNTYVIIIGTRKYNKILATAKYLINNSTFPSYFIKKEGQIYVNTWHGTPLKNLGKNIIDDPNEIGNTQRNFIMADYLLYPNEFTYEKMTEDYMIKNYFTGKYILAGYPRNDIFFNDKSEIDKIKADNNLNNKKIVVYMPTWRGNLSHNKNLQQNKDVISILDKLSSKLDKDTVLFVKLHALTSSYVNFNKYNNIFPFPNNYETYEFLRIADCLITDYSSVFFDFMNTGKKIVLFGYDKDQYKKEKGMYIDYDSLPYPQVNNVEELAKELKILSKFNSYESFSKKYNKYDTINSSELICDFIFNGKESSKIKIIDGKKVSNNKENILIYPGGFVKNGITTALRNLVNVIDRDKYNYILTFYIKNLEKNKQIIRDYNNIDYIPIRGRLCCGLFEGIIYILNSKFKIKTKFIDNIMDGVYKREAKRLYGNIKFKYVIHYTGYVNNIMGIFRNMDAKKVIYIHNDMGKEVKIKKNVNEHDYKIALAACDKIVCIRETSKEEILRFEPNLDKSKLVVAHNINDIEGIKKKAKQDIEFQKNTECSVSLDELKRILNNKSINKIINIGRFSKEKGQERLINAFEKFAKDNKDTYLIIIGGYGILYNKIKYMVENCSSKRIILISSINNPFSILSKCDMFILSSFYEGLPMTIMEALILDKLVLSTDIPGPKEFLEKGYGILLNNSEEGIYKGLIDYKKGVLKPKIKFDAYKFNSDALEEFYKVIDK